MQKTILKELKLPLILILEIALCLTLGAFIPETVKSLFYGISMILKNALVFLLPFIIFSILFSNLGNLSRTAFAFTALAFLGVIVSNFTSTCLAGMLGTGLLDVISLKTFTGGVDQNLSPIWQLPIWSEALGSFNPVPLLEAISSTTPFLWLSKITNDMGLFAGILGGLILAFLGHGPTKKFAKSMHDAAFVFFRKFFIPLIPIFVLGYILNMEHTGVLDSIVDNYLGVVAAIALFAYGYIILLYGAASKFNLGRWRHTLQNLTPAALTGFSTMSSASALPLLIEGVRKNARLISKNKDTSKIEETSTSIVPISVNIHLIGDCFTIPILALAIMMSFGMGLPSLNDYLIFTVFFVLAKFAVAAVPGGGILVMIPILEKYLGFSPEMISLITALYILFDPVITSANVFGNGAFAGLFGRLFQKLSKTKKKQNLNQKGMPRSQIS